MNKLELTGISKIILPIFIIFLFYQCMHDEYEFGKLDKEMEIEAGVLAPVAYGSLGLDDIISEFDSTGTISSDTDGLLYITYKDSLFSFTANELLEIPEQDFFEYFIESDFTFPPIWDTATIDRQENFPFVFDNNEEIDSIQLDAGNMIFNITSDFLHTGKVDMVFPNITLNGTPLTHTINITDASGTFTTTSNIPLDNYTIHLNDSSTTDTMFLPAQFHVELYNSGGLINPGDQIVIQATMSALDFDAIFGYIGDYELLSQTGDLDLGFFQNTLDGFIQFENPQLNLNIQNSYGLPAEVDISRFVGFKGNEDSIALNLNPSVNPFRYAYPTLSDYQSSNIIKDTVISINGNNSSISDFLAFMPSKLEFNMTVASNPDGPGGPYNFVTDDSRIDVDLEFILPLYFKADSFVLKDTIGLDLLNVDEDADFIERVNIMLKVSNGLPLDIDFQLYFLDSLYNPVDTLFTEGSQPVIASGLIDDITHEVTEPGVKTSLVEYTNDEINRLNTVKYGLIRAGLKTPDDNNGNLVSVKFFTTYTVDFNLSVGIDVKANTNDF